MNLYTGVKSGIVYSVHCTKYIVQIVIFKSDITHSSGISVHYLLEVKMFKKSGTKAKLYWHVNLPVTMGTIPLSPANAAAQSHTPHTATLTTPNVSTATLATPNVSTATLATPNVSTASLTTPNVIIATLTTPNVSNSYCHPHHP